MRLIMCLIFATLSGIFCPLLAGAAGSSAPMDTAAKHAEPGVSYGTTDTLSTPKTVLFSASPDSIIADAETWASHGVNAFFMDYVAREWSSDIWAADGKPWTIGPSDEMFQKARQANEICRRIGSETFLKISFDHFFEWFNDAQWDQAYHNFGQFAYFARETGCTGMALDIEYVGPQYSFDWEGYDYNGYTRQDLVRKIRERMTKVIQILYAGFPDMVFLTFPEQGLGLGQVIHVCWLEEAARRNAPGGIHYCTEHTYRNPNIREMLAYAWACNDLFYRLLSARAWKYWVEKCSLSIGVWPFGFDYETVHSPGMPLEDLRQGLAAAQMISPKYDWIYSHNCYEQLIGRGRDQFTGEAPLDDYLKIFSEKNVITDEKYAALAQEMRTKVLRDYSSELGWMPFVSFAGPRDVPQIRLLPSEGTSLTELSKTWTAALRYFRGEDVDLHQLFATQTHWMLLGPFSGGDKLEGHNSVFPPEQSIDTGAEYDGAQGKIHWIEYDQPGNKISVDLAKVFSPAEDVTAYALCYITNPKERSVQFRVGTNDAGKVWLNGALIFDYPYEGTAFLDRDIIPVTLPGGTSQVLLKISNAKLNWGFVFRVTDSKGQPLHDLTYSMTHP